MDPLSSELKEEPDDEMIDTNKSLAGPSKRRKVPIIFEDSEVEMVKEEPDEDSFESDNSNDSLVARQCYKGRKTKRNTESPPTGSASSSPSPTPSKRRSNDSLVARQCYKGRKTKRNTESPSTGSASSSPSPTPSKRRSNDSLVARQCYKGRKTKRNTESPSTGSASSSPSPTPSKRRSLRSGRATPLASLSTSSRMRHLPPGRRTRKNLQEAEIINFGSDADSNESDEGEDLAVVPMVPRAIRSMIPWAQDEVEGEEVAGDGGAAAASPADAPAADCAPSATDQPWSLFDFQWREFPNPPIPPASRRETFSQKNFGPTIPYVDPYDIFVAIWDRQFMEYIASETNRYAQQLTDQMMERLLLHPQSRILRWQNTIGDEMYVLFAICLAMGIVVKSKLEDYWTASSDIFMTPGFSAYMSYNRFNLLLKCLHFVNNEDMCAHNLDGSEARLFKIKPLLSHLNLKFQMLYIPSRNLALDESLLMWKGQLDISQLIPNRAANRGIKTYEICESRTGYLWRFEVHAHSRSAPKPPEPENPLETFTPAVVLRLTQGLKHKGYTLWMDSFYNSPVLARRLKSLGFDCVGTLRTDRQFLPEALHNLTKDRMRRGDISGLTSGDVDVMVWRDNNRVAMISTYHGNAVQDFQGSTEPILIHDYNIKMGGMDKKDQLLAMYPIERKRTKIWYKKLFKRLLNVSVLNSYIIHRQNSPSSSSLRHLKFRINLIKSLLSKHSSATLSHPRAMSQTSENLTHDVSHRLEYLPAVTGNNRRLRRQCVVCKKLERMFCVGCDKTVCLSPCFLILHSQ